MDRYVIISALSGIGGAMLGIVVFYFINRALISLKMSRRVTLSQFSQEEAEDLLKKKGFKIIGRQKRADIITYVDNKPNLGYVQADLIVEKNGKRYVAEVKAGELVSEATEPSTRRQLLEYKFAYKPYGILLVDMISKSIHSVDFELPSYADDKIFRLILASLIVIIVLGLIWVFMSIRIL